jgi:hypothetical protein
MSSCRVSQLWSEHLSAMIRADKGWRTTILIRWSRGVICPKMYLVIDPRFRSLSAHMVLGHEYQNDTLEYIHKFKIFHWTGPKLSSLNLILTTEYLEKVWLPAEFTILSMYVLCYTSIGYVISKEAVAASTEAKSKCLLITSIDFHTDLVLNISWRWLRLLQGDGQ